VNLALGKHGNRAIVIRLAGIMMQMLVQDGGGGQGLQAKKDGQAKERKCPFDSRRPRWKVRPHAF